MGRPADVAFYRVVKGEQKADDGWIEWAGEGVCPVDEMTIVQARRMDGFLLEEPAGRLRWWHLSTDADIVGYRVSKYA